MLLIGILVGGTLGYQLGCQKAAVKDLAAKLNPSNWGKKKEDDEGS